jgi:hypothetical protein
MQCDHRPRSQAVTPADADGTICAAPVTSRSATTEKQKAGAQPWSRMDSGPPSWGRLRQALALDRFVRLLGGVIHG